MWYGEPPIQGCQIGLTIENYYTVRYASFPVHTASDVIGEFSNISPVAH